MNVYLTGILINLISNVISWTLVFLIGFSIYISKRIVEQRRLLKFLNLKSNHNIRVYLSSFFLESGSFFDLSNQPTMWSGYALSAGEFLTVRDIDKWLLVLTKKPDIIDYLFEKIVPLRLQIPKITVDYLPSPESFDGVFSENSTLFFVGGPLHNIGTKQYCDEEHRTCMRSLDWKMGVEIRTGKKAGEVLGDNISQEDFFKRAGNNTKDWGVLEKLTDPERNSTIFIASGVSINGTRAAVRYLVTHWREIQSCYKELPFAICLECTHADQDPEGYLDYIVRHELKSF